MQEILFGYKLNPTTWAYISALMMLGIYFKFHRFWSVRNLDLAALIAFSPGLLLIYYGLVRQWPELMKAWGMTTAAGSPPADLAKHLIEAGYVWLFAVGVVFLVRLLLDPMMVRRPLLEPNLSAGGLTFTGLAMLVFLMANVITCPPERLEYLLAKQAKQEATPATPDPGYPLFDKFSNFADQAMIPVAQLPPATRHEVLLQTAAAHALTILAHLAVVAGMVWIGFRHFDNIQTGVAAATLYLLSFYTSQMTARVDYVAPAMLLIWAIAAYRRPLISGILIGVVGGLIFYPLFLLPLWCAFYWRRGMVRFGFGVVAALVVLVASLAFLAPDVATFAAQTRQMFGVRNPLDVKLVGFWQFYDPAYRIPVMTLFAAICGGLAFWPAQKNLGTLLSCSAAVMLATQFWHAHQGGLCMGWYLPLLILTIFRPNLEDRVALSAVRPAWGRRRQPSSNAARTA